MQFVLDDNDSIHGKLDYTFTDRQPLHGSIEGMKEGKIIDLKYTYVDSGKVKAEEMVFKYEGDKLYKKNGAMVEDNGVLVLENPLRATLQLFLIQTDCK